MTSKTSDIRSATSSLVKVNDRDPACLPLVIVQKVLQFLQVRDLKPGVCRSWRNIRDLGIQAIPRLRREANFIRNPLVDITDSVRFSEGAEVLLNNAKHLVLIERSASGLNNLIVNRKEHGSYFIVGEQQKHTWDTVDRRDGPNVMKRVVRSIEGEVLFFSQLVFLKTAIKVSLMSWHLDQLTESSKILQLNATPICIATGDVIHTWLTLPKRRQLLLTQKGILFLVDSKRAITHTSLFSADSSLSVKSAFLLEGQRFVVLAENSLKEQFLGICQIDAIEQAVLFRRIDAFAVVAWQDGIYGLVHSGNGLLFLAKYDLAKLERTERIFLLSDFTLPPTNMLCLNAYDKGVYIRTGTKTVVCDLYNQTLTTFPVQQVGYLNITNGCEFSAVNAHLSTQTFQRSPVSDPKTRDKRVFRVPNFKEQCTSYKCFEDSILLSMRVPDPKTTSYTTKLFCLYLDRDTRQDPKAVQEFSLSNQEAEREIKALNAKEIELKGVKAGLDDEGIAERTLDVYWDNEIIVENPARVAPELMRALPKKVKTCSKFMAKLRDGLLQPIVYFRWNE